MKQVNLTQEQIDKLLNYCEEMLEMCDIPEERQVYEDIISELTK